MSVTAVPLPPVERRVTGGLWLALALLALIGIGFGVYSTSKIVPSAAAFLARNAKKPGVVVTASGLQYQVLHLGTGPRPTVHDIAAINYSGRLADGTLFDASALQGGPVQLPVGGNIPGFSEGLTLMPVGSKFRFWIPPNLAYGAAGAGNGVIPPNAALDFEVELLAVAPQSMMTPQNVVPPPNNAGPQTVPSQPGEAPAAMSPQPAEPPLATSAQPAESQAGPTVE
jgi:hypothetical protein